MLLLGLVLLSGALFATIAAAVAGWWFGISDLQTFLSSMEEQSCQPLAFLVIQGISALGAFVLPALLFPRIQRLQPVAYYQMGRAVDIRLVAFAILTLLFSQSAISLLSELNGHLVIPESWGTVGEWLRGSHDEVQQGYAQLLNFQSFGHMLLALLVMAVVPALGEELIFRGAMQQVLKQWTGYGHVAVWLAAAIFSLFHFQVYLFLPRLLLGAVMGYLFLWSGNLWYPILAHFANNAWVVLSAYFFLPDGGVEELLRPESDLPWATLAGGVLAFLAFLLLFRKKALQWQPHDTQLGESFQHRAEVQSGDD
jgi:membrane protease YdiL (CAAX protease family)